MHDKKMAKFDLFYYTKMHFCEEYTSNLLKPMYFLLASELLHTFKAEKIFFELNFKVLSHFLLYLTYLWSKFAS